MKFGREQEARPEYESVGWPADREGDPPLPSLDGPDLVEITERILAMWTFSDLARQSGPQDTP